MTHREQAEALWNEIEYARVIDFEGSTLNEKECVSLIESALKAQRAEECEAIAKEFRDNWDGAEVLPEFLKWLYAEAEKLHS